MGLFLKKCRLFVENLGKGFELAVYRGRNPKGHQQPDIMIKTCARTCMSVRMFSLYVLGKYLKIISSATWWELMEMKASSDRQRVRVLLMPQHSLQ